MGTLRNIQRRVVTVIGGSGFIGSHVPDQALESGVVRYKGSADAMRDTFIWKMPPGQAWRILVKTSATRAWC